MSRCIALLEQAMEVCEREIVCLSKGDVEGAEAMAADRVRLMAEAEKDFAVQDASLLKQSLERLLTLQGRATSEAKSLQEGIRGKLGRTKKEAKRLAGYSGARKPARRIRNVYLNKQG